MGRNYDSVTSVAGYAGGSEVGPDGQACYHGRYAYESMGHAEVVNMNVPDNKFKDFAEVYFSLFLNGARSDVGDRGPAYRQLVGIPDGINSYLFEDLQEVADSYSINLIEGFGDEGDNVLDHSIYVMDSTEFEFVQAEFFHQFHDGFRSEESYP